MGDVIVSMEHITKEFPGVKALDDNTLQVTLVRPVNYFDRLVGFPVFFPQNQKFVEEKGDKYGTTKDDILSNVPCE